MPRRPKSLRRNHRTNKGVELEINAWLNSHAAASDGRQTCCRLVLVQAGPPTQQEEQHKHSSPIEAAHAVESESAVEAADAAPTQIAARTQAQQQ